MEFHDSKPPRPVVPRLSFNSSKPIEADMPSTRSEPDDIIIPTSFRLNLKDSDEEKLPEQISRLNTLLEGVMGNLFPGQEDLSMIEGLGTPDMKCTMGKIVDNLKEGDMTLMLDNEELRGKSDLEKVYEFELSKLRVDLENLSTTTLPDFTTNVPKVLPKFCKKVIKLIADIIENGVKKYTIKSKLKETMLSDRFSVTCKVKELDLINRRLLELANEVQELEEEKACKLKLGDLEINLNVIPDPNQKTTTFKSMLDCSNLDESMHNVSMISHIQELEDHISDLQNGFDFQMAAAVGEADQDHVRDLEFKIEKLTQELEVERMKNRQQDEIDQLHTFRANRDNLYDLEVKLIEDAEKLKLERFALEKKSQQLDAERENVQIYKADCEKEFEGLK